MLLAMYSMVLLHSAIPHFHQDHVSEIWQLGDGHHSHHHDDYHHHQDDTSHNGEMSLFHALGHLFGDSAHVHGPQHYLTPDRTDYKITVFQAKVICAVVLSFSQEPKFALKKENLFSFSPPPYEWIAQASTPLRGPPSLV